MLANYTRMLSDADLGTAWINTLIYVAIAVSVETVFGVLVAALINQVRVGRQWLLAAVVLPWALPGVVNAVIWMWIYQPGAGLLNGILTIFGLPFDNHVWFNDRTSAIVAVADRPYLAHDAADRRHRARGHAERSPVISTRPRESTARRDHRCSC